MPATIKTRLNATQIKILQCLANAKDWLTRKELEECSGCSILHAVGPAMLDNLPEFEENQKRRTLVGLGYVKAQDIEGMGVCYYVTPLGREVAHSHRFTTYQDCEIPKDTLITAIQVFRESRSYPFEYYTEDDWDEFLLTMPSEYIGTDHELVKNTLIKYRKSGYLKKDTGGWPAWYTEYRESEHFLMVEEEVRKANKTCAINMDHTEDLTVYHRTFVTIGSESTKHMITLCQKCHKKLAKLLPAPPDDEPDNLTMG